jgi:hypothetical protein
MYSSTSGMRQSWLRIEMQLLPGLNSEDTTGQAAIPFLGSAALYYNLAP